VKQSFSVKNLSDFDGNPIKELSEEEKSEKNQTDKNPNNLDEINLKKQSTLNEFTFSKN
jgi:hypothetical protein